LRDRRREDGIRRNLDYDVALLDMDCLTLVVRHETIVTFGGVGRSRSTFPAWTRGPPLRRLLSRERVYRVASAIGHASRVFAASVLVSLLFFHANEGAAVVAPLALGALAVIVAPAAIEGQRARR
jgi:hypothetical protein